MGVSNELSEDNYRLLKLIDKRILKNIMESLALAAGLKVNIVDTQGSFLLGTLDTEQNCRFCQLIWQYQKGFKRCQEAYSRAGKQAFMMGEPYIFRCPAGLIQFVAPIIIDGEHLASIICGQVLMWEPEDFFWLEIEKMNAELKLDKSKLMEAAKELPVLSAKKVEAAANLSFVVANYIMKSGWEDARNRREITEQQKLLADEIENRKVADTNLGPQKNLFDSYLDEEEKLISEIKVGNIESASRQFRSLLVDLVISGASNIEYIRARLIELVVVMSRVAVESGADLDKINKENILILKNINSSKQIDELLLTATKALETYLELKAENSRVKNHNLINQVKQFIRNNYSDNLTLEDIAAFVFLSSSHLSRIFKQELGITIMDYLVQVRIEVAKKLLKNPQHKIDDIAEHVGYSDSSHFAKVFKRYEGISPSKYRQQV